LCIFEHAQCRDELETDAAGADARAPSMRENYIPAVDRRVRKLRHDCGNTACQITGTRKRPRLARLDGPWIDVLDALCEEFSDHADGMQAHGEYPRQGSEANHGNEDNAHDQFGHDRSRFNIALVIR